MWLICAEIKGEERRECQNSLKKFLEGKFLTEDDWSEHLKEAHRIAPSMTPHAFASYTTVEGKNSYELLVEKIPDHLAHPVQVVDLACGDGFLVPYLLLRLGKTSRVLGVDMSEGEIHIAMKSIVDSRVSFHLAAAQNLPGVDHSTDFIVSFGTHAHASHRAGRK